MTTEEHPITPPPELVQEWLCDDNYPCDSYTNATISIAAGRLRNVATQAARWGADQELEACCEWAAEQDRDFDLELRAARRPKPSSLKEQALKELAWVDKNLNMPLLNQCDAIHTIRRAIEALPD